MGKTVYDIFIIGAGPAGMTAAIYGSRANYSTAMIDKDAPGGKLIKTAEIENWTGFKKVTGPDLALDMYGHSTAFGAKHLYGNVVEMIDEGNHKRIILEDGKQYLAKAVIIATGTKEREMGIPGEKELYGTGISYCAICDGAFYKDKEVVVIGGGNSALEESIYLTKFASKVTIIYRGEEFKKAEATTVDKVHANDKIKIILQATPKSIEKYGEGIKLTYTQSGEDKIIQASCVFPFIGLIPETQFVKDTSVLTEAKYVDADESTITKIPGVFVSGDVRNKKIRQISTAVGDGTVAAQEAIHYLDNLK